MKAAAWSVPVITTAIAAPAAAASVLEAGAFRIDAECSTTETSRGSFALAASSDRPLPAGTLLLLTRGDQPYSRVSFSGLYLSFLGSANGTLSFTVVSAIPAGEITKISLSSETGDGVFSLRAVLPTGYIGTGSKATAILNFTRDICSVG